MRLATKGGSMRTVYPGQQLEVSASLHMVKYQAIIIVVEVKAHVSGQVHMPQGLVILKFYYGCFGSTLCCHCMFMLTS